MLHLHRKHRKKLSKSNELIFVRFFTAIGLACIDTIWALYMESFGLNESTIGFISGFLVLFSILMTFVSIPVIEKFNQNKLLFFSLIVTAVAYFSIAFFNSLWIFLLMALLLTIAAVFRIDCFDILFRDSTSKKDLNKEEGLLYTFINLGWLIGPIIAGIIILRYGLLKVFYIASLFFILGVIVYWSMHLKSNIKKRKKIDSNPIENIVSYFKNKKLHLPYIMASGIEVWWALVYVYVPLFMIKNSLTEGHVSIFMAFIIVPLVLMEFLVGKLSEKTGFKIMFTSGYLGLTIASILLFFTNFIGAQMVILIFACAFVGFLEPIQDTYFFKNVTKKEEEKYYPIFATSSDIGSFIGKMGLAVTLVFLPSNFVYLVMAIMMFGYFLVSLKISKKAH